MDTSSGSYSHMTTQNDTLTHTIEIFRTNVCSEELASHLVKALQVQFPFVHFNFDLSDCDCILRADPGHSTLKTEQVVAFMRLQNLICEVIV